MSNRYAPQARSLARDPALSTSFRAVFALSLFAACSPKQEAAPPAAAPQVKVAQVLQRDVPVYVEAIGETRGNTEIEIRARVEGFLDTVDFKEGAMIKKGQLLYTIDPRPFEASLAQAKAAVAEAEAQLARTHQDVVRYEPLVAKNAISREEYDTAVALEKAASATLDAIKAAKDKSEIDLSYTKVIAPDDGLVGKTEVYAGTLVGRGTSTLLTHISRIDPIHVRVTIPERDYLTMARKKAARAPADEAPKVPFDLVLADGTIDAGTGHLVFIDRTVDPRTGTILLEVAFPNPSGIVRPGQYARLRAQVEMKAGAILVPQGAVKELQGVYSVMVAAQDGTVEQRVVQTGQRVGPLWVIDSGLAAGEHIVVEGLQKIRAGMKVDATTVLIGEDKEKAAEEAASAEAAKHENASPAADEKPAHEKK
jgi:membrane fusion protein (multidrug efflux system)